MQLLWAAPRPPPSHGPLQLRAGQKQKSQPKAQPPLVLSSGDQGAQSGVLPGPAGGGVKCQVEVSALMDSGSKSTLSVL